MAKPGIVKGNPGPPPAMSVVKDEAQVPLPSQEGTKGVVQYALYVARKDRIFNGVGKLT